MRKKTNRYGNRTLTVKELQELLPRLECGRAEALEIGKKIGVRDYIIDILRGLLGFTATMPPRIPKEKIDRLIEVYQNEPEKSLYQIYRDYKDELGLDGGYQSYYAIVRKAGLECNRKRNYWTVFKDKQLLHLRNDKHLSFSEIQKQMPGRTKNALMQRYEKITKKGAA